MPKIWTDDADKWFPCLLIVDEVKSWECKDMFTSRLMTREKVLD
jgi:hypothetical protein